MYFKFISAASGETTVLQCDGITFIGQGPAPDDWSNFDQRDVANPGQYEAAHRAFDYDGEPPCMYGSHDQYPPSFFAIAQNGIGRVIIGVPLRAGWLMADDGGTIDSVLMWDRPQDIAAALSTS